MISIKTSPGFFPDFDRKSPDQLLFFAKDSRFFKFGFSSPGSNKSDGIFLKRELSSQFITSDRCISFSMILN